MTKTREAIEAEALEAARKAWMDDDPVTVSEGSAALTPAMAAYLAALWQPIGDCSAIPTGDVPIVLWSEIDPPNAHIIRASHYHEAKRYPAAGLGRHMYDHMTHWRYFEGPTVTRASEPYPDTNARGG